MEKEKDMKTINKRAPYLNGYNTKINGSAKRKNNGISASIKDHIVTSDGRVFYLCQFCNKVFPIKKSRTFHIKKCPAKEYILSVEDKPKAIENVPQEPLVKRDMPEVKKPSNKIDIQQNIVLNNQMNVSEILAKTQSPPIKLTIRRSPNTNGSETSNHFTVSNSLIQKEENESNDEFSTIAKRLENNAVTIIRQVKKDDRRERVNLEKNKIVETHQKIEKQGEPLNKEKIQKEGKTQIKEKTQAKEMQTIEETQIVEKTQLIEKVQTEEKTQIIETVQAEQNTQIEDKTKEDKQILKEESAECDQIVEEEEEAEEEEDAEEEGSDEGTETTCRECTKEFECPIELLRHARKSHSYPKVLMALSEVKKFYSAKDRSQCPICHKPLKNKFRSAFVKHLHTHTNEMKYSCTVCNKKFRRSDHMKAHEKRHIVKDKKRENLK